MTTIEEIKAELGPLLIPADRILPQMGVETNWSALDKYLAWNGLPKGALSLFTGASGFGATSLWAQAAASVTKSKRWCAWVNAHESGLCPWALRKIDVDFRHLLTVAAPRDGEQLLWALQEIVSLSLFELIGCDLGELRLRTHQLLKLNRLVQRAGAALVLMSSRSLSYASPIFSLVVEFTANGVCLSRALHRPTPFVLPRRDTYADIMPQLAQSGTTCSGRDLPHLQSESPLSHSGLGVR